VFKKTLLGMSLLCAVSAVGLAQNQGTIIGWGSNVGTGEEPLPIYDQAIPQTATTSQQKPASLKRRA
jgi:hypothetical protein